MNNLMAQLISEMDQQEVDAVLHMLHKRTCDLAEGKCYNCPWRWSILCKYVYEYKKAHEYES